MNKERHGPGSAIPRHPEPESRSGTQAAPRSYMYLGAKNYPSLLAKPSTSTVHSSSLRAKSIQSPPANSVMSSDHLFAGCPTERLAQTRNQGCQASSLRDHLESVRRASFPANNHLRRRCKLTHSTEPCRKNKSSHKCVERLIKSIHDSSGRPETRTMRLSMRHRVAVR